MTIIKAFEFDNYNCGESKPNPQVVVEEDEHYQLSVILKFTDGREKSEIPLVSTCRDQWGVFVSVPGATIAQEDDTRSFLDAFIKALTVIRSSVELATESTELPSEQTNETTEPTKCSECAGEKFQTEQDYWDKSHCPRCGGSGTEPQSD